MKLYRWFGFYSIKNPKSVRVRIMPYTMKPQIKRFR